MMSVKGWERMMTCFIFSARAVSFELWGVCSDPLLYQSAKVIVIETKNT